MISPEMFSAGCLFLIVIATWSIMMSVSKLAARIEESFAALQRSMKEMETKLNHEGVLQRHELNQIEKAIRGDSPRLLPEQ